MDVCALKGGGAQNELGQVSDCLPLVTQQIFVANEVKKNIVGSGEPVLVVLSPNWAFLLHKWFPQLLCFLKDAIFDGLGMSPSGYHVEQTCHAVHRVSKNYYGLRTSKLRVTQSFREVRLDHEHSAIDDAFASHAQLFELPVEVPPHVAVRPRVHSCYLLD